MARKVRTNMRGLGRGAFTREVSVNLVGGHVGLERLALHIGKANQPPKTYTSPARLARNVVRIEESCPNRLQCRPSARHQNKRRLLGHVQYFADLGVAHLPDRAKDERSATTLWKCRQRGNKRSFQLIVLHIFVRKNERWGNVQNFFLCQPTRAPQYVQCSVPDGTH